MQGMNNNNTINKEVLARVSVQTGFTKNNLNRTYITNQNGIDKSKIVRVMVLGSLCTEKGMTDEEMDLVMKFIDNVREFNGK